MKTQTTYSGMKIKPVLAAQGRMARWLAAQVGISESHLSRMMSGERPVPEETAQRIAAAVQVPFFVLFDSPDGHDLRPDDEEEVA